MIYPARKDYSSREKMYASPVFSLDPNRRFDRFCMGVVDLWVFRSLSLEAQGLYFGLITWQTYWASGINFYSSSPHFSPKDISFWRKTFQISSKKFMKIAKELEENSLIKITENGLILLWDFHYSEEKK